MSKHTRSHLNLQEYHISDLLYCSPSRILINSHPGFEQSGTHLLPQQNSLITMAASRKTSESGGDGKTDDGMPSLDSKSTLQSLREQEKIALQSINKLTEEEMTQIDQWLSTLHNTYESLEYPPLHRVLQATTYFGDEQQLWYEQTKTEINNDWLCFCDRLKQHIQDRQKVQVNSSIMNHQLLNINGTTSLEDLIDTEFSKYSGMGDAKAWLLQIMNQFKQYGLHRLEQCQALPFLLVDTAYLWYVENIELITSFESFSKLFLQRFSSTSSVVRNNIPNEIVMPPTIDSGSSSISYLQQTVANEIIKKTNIFSWFKR
jgi:hypothetical protein